MLGEQIKICYVSDLVSISVSFVSGLVSLDDAIVNVTKDKSEWNVLRTKEYLLKMNTYIQLKEHRIIQGLDGDFASTSQECIIKMRD